LIDRGRINLWYNEEALMKWDDAPYEGRGRPQKYADIAITAIVACMLLFRTGLRQSIGFAQSFLDALGKRLPAPDYTTISRRMRRLRLPDLSRVHRGENVYAMLDSTGLKVFGEREWMSYKYKNIKDRKTWKKLHATIDQHGRVMAVSLTDAHASDDSQVTVMLNAIKSPISKVIADGGYHACAVNRCFTEREHHPAVIVPPPPNAKVSPEHSDQENAHIEYIATKGRLRWNVKHEHNKRNLVENFFSRYKTIFGNKLRSRHPLNQAFEVSLASHILNQFIEAVRPLPTQI
jgi:transposase